MSQVTTDLPTNGRTQFFNFQYDDSLSAARGVELATDLMNHCDADLSLLAAWFSGRQLDMSPPINVSLGTIAIDSAGNPLPSQFIGAQWIGAVAWPLQVTLFIGEFPIASGTATMLARYLLVSEVSEMYMRAFNAHGPNPWFRFSEGNKGEGLSRFLAAQFLMRSYPGVTAIPSLTFPGGAGVWNVTNLWLDSDRSNWLEVNDEDIQPDPVTGCATLFLFYLHDQLGYRIEDIVNAGAGHLSNVYEKLTRDSWVNAWPNFSGLVDAHLPHEADKDGVFTPSYSPPLDTVFPVSDLTTFSATGQVSWVPAQIPPVLTVTADHPARTPVRVPITSSHPTIVPDSVVTISSSTQAAVRNLKVLPQPPGFTSLLVTLTATYAGRALTTAVRVVNPDTIGLPALVIDTDRSQDRCRALFIEGDSQVFRINNLSVFADQSGMKFAWSAAGVAPGATDEETLYIPALPAAGTAVTVQVTVANARGLHAKGTFAFETRPDDLDAVHEELRCRLNNLKNLTVNLPPWEPRERAEGRQVRLRELREQVRTVSVTATAVTKVIQRAMEAR